MLLLPWVKITDLPVYVLFIFCFTTVFVKVFTWSSCWMDTDKLTSSGCHCWPNIRVTDFKILFMFALNFAFWCSFCFCLSKYSLETLSFGQYNYWMSTEELISSCCHWWWPKVKVTDIDKDTHEPPDLLLKYKSSCLGLPACLCMLVRFSWFAFYTGSCMCHANFSILLQPLFDIKAKKCKEGK